MPSITRKTDKGLPRYYDADQSDVFDLAFGRKFAPARLLFERVLKPERNIYE